MIHVLLARDRRARSKDPVRNLETQEGTILRLVTSTSDKTQDHFRRENVCDQASCRYAATAVDRGRSCFNVNHVRLSSQKHTTQRTNTLVQVRDKFDGLRRLTRRSSNDIRRDASSAFTANHRIMGKSHARATRRTRRYGTRRATRTGKGISSSNRVKSQSNSDDFLPLFDRILSHILSVEHLIARVTVARYEREEATSGSYSDAKAIKKKISGHSTCRRNRT